MYKKHSFEEKPPRGLILHSDQGWHYQHKSYQNKLILVHLLQYRKIMTIFAAPPQKWGLN